MVTGASSGIGRAVAFELAERGARLLLNARRNERLTLLAEQLRQRQVQVEYVAGDVADPAVRQALIDAAVERLEGLDVLVNNAGIGAFGRFESASPERLRRIMEVNFFGTVEMTRLALPLLKRGQQPLVVNVSSILGHRGIPHCSEYCASKFAVQGFSESLRAELHPLGIDLLVVSPGTTDTGFFDNVIERKGERPWGQQTGVPAEHVARQMVRAMERGRHEIIPNRRGRMLCWLNRLSPWLADVFLARYG